MGCDSLLLFVLINLFFRCLVLLSISTILLTIEHPDLSVSYFIHISRECGYACAYHCRSFACEPAVNHLTNLLSSFPGVRLVACSTITALIIYFSFLSVYSFCYVSYAYRKCGVPPLSHLFLTPQGFCTLVVIISCFTNPHTTPFPVRCCSSRRSSALHISIYFGLFFQLLASTQEKNSYSLIKSLRTSSHR